MPRNADPHLPVMPDARIKIVPASEPVRARVASNELCTFGKKKSASFVRHFCVDLSGTPLAGSFLPGQAFGVVAPGLDDAGKPHAVRLYSSASPSWGEDGAGNVISTSVKRLIDERAPQRPGDDPGDHRLFLGVCSNHMCDLREGDDVWVTGPAGKRFLLPVDVEAHDYVFMATGTGIAPFRAMALELLRRPQGAARSQIHLISGFPYTSDLIYHELFTQLAAEHPNFHYHTVISREGPGGRGIYLHKYMERELAQLRPVLGSPRTILYMCGLAGMDWGVYQVLVAAGLHEGYLNLSDRIAGVPPSAWGNDVGKRDLRPTDRFLVEVY